MPSITQDNHTSTKPQEFIDLVQDYGNLQKVNVDRVPNQDNDLDQLRKLAALKDDGLITEEEYATKKKKLLGI